MLPDVSIDVQVDEAVLIACAGARLALKNLFILRTLRDGKAFDHTWYSTAVREELLNLANETDSDADRVLVERERAIKRQGRALFQDDYRLIDADLLDRREKVLRGLAARLRTLSADENHIAMLISEAREQALDEVVAAVSLGPLPGQAPEPDAMMLHQERLAALYDDLEELLASARR
ncbi:hypothetical protein ACFFGH_13025 [Lysobacter korlensis]|uniref:Uncharacterized protein n=1 Tax=Lysobacter korlensis TaxID=553636 RepID=A0ABV6RP52_9GAMM